MIVIPDETLACGRAVARSYLQQHPVADENSRAAIEAFLTVYEAVKQRTESHDAALFVASQEGRMKLRAKPVTRRFTYPPAPGVILQRVETTPGVLAGYFSFLTQAAENAIDGAAVPQAVAVQERTYVLHKPIVEQQLVGLEQEQQAMEKYVRQLFLYNPKAMENPDAGRFPKTVLLTGPPGTGKSSLIKHFIAKARHLQRITGTPFTTEVYDASNFSSYFGKSTRILKQKLARVQNPRGVGLFCIEDADMVLQSRSDSQAFHGVLELQQYLMNHLSGLQPYYGNTITVLTTNRPDSLDDALQSRMQARFAINPFSLASTHEAYFSLHFPDVDAAYRLYAGQLTYAAGLAGRDLESVSFLVREATTRAPSDEELAKRVSNNRYSSVTKELLERVIAGYTAARRTRAS